MTRTKMTTVTGVTLTLAAMALSGCAGPAKTTQTAPATASAAAAAANTLSGKVVETMDAGGYTYVNLEKDGKKQWIAAPVMKVSVGQEITLLPGAELSNFSSKSLNRTFEKIIFSGGLVQGAAPAPAAAADDAKESAEPILVGKVVETMDAAQYTYLLLEKDGKRAWSAIPFAEVKVGDEVELQPGTAMGKFTSKRLNRTFNAIYFAGGLKGKTASATASAAPAEAPLPAGHPKVESAAQAAPSEAMAPITGKVVETTDAGGYTYLCLEKEGKKTWVAVPPMKAEIGQEVSVSPGVAMTNFASKSLNRTFDKIIFSQGAVTK